MKLVTVVFVAALVPRLVAAWQLGELPLSRTPQLDSLEYLIWAREIAASGFAWVPYPEHAPGYPFFLGAALALTGGSLTGVRVVQAVIASVSCVLTARVAARSLRDDAFLPAGLLQALYAPFIYLDTAVLAEPLFIFLILLALDYATRASEAFAVRGAPHPGSRLFFASGLAIGAASIVRPTALVLLLVLPLISRRRTAALIAGASIVIIPVVVQNWRVTGVPLIQAYGGMNLYLGNTPTSDGAARARPGALWDTLEADATREGVERNDQDRYFVDKTLTEMGGDPAGWLRVTANKLAWLTQQEELRDTHSFYFFVDALPVLRWLPGFGMVLAFAVVGLLTIRNTRDPRWVLLSLAAMTATVLFLVVGLRYRAPMVPMVIMIAAAGIASIVAAIRTAEWKRVAVGGAVMLLVFSLSNLRSDAASRNVAEEWAITGVALLSENRYTDAEAALRRAIELDQRSAYAWDSLGLVLQRQERIDEARAAFERSVQLNGAYAAGWHHLGFLQERTNHLEAAIIAYDRALRVAPERTDIILSMGLALHRAGLWDAAVPHLAKAANRGEGRAHFALALIAMERRDLETARRHAAEAVRLMPGYQPARQLLLAVQAAR